LDSDLNLDPEIKIRGMRNRIVHAYDYLNDDIMWSISTNGYLKGLKTRVETLLNS
jgi:uncharacterized protein with HEPN domain